jgi:pilus assembly protein FimV
MRGETVSRSITSAILAAAFWFAAPLAAHAAGLGRLVVLSSLGQPLNAEIELVSLQKGEEEGLVARLAPLEAYQQAGIEPSSALVGVRFTIERRAGRPILRVTTSQSVNEPFVELLIDLQWTTGRLVREYTVLLDPPEYKARQAIAAAPPAAAKPAAPAEPKPAPSMEAKPLEAAPAPAAPAPIALAPSAPASVSPAPDATPAPVAASPATATPAAAPAPGATHEVRKGDTLGAIARSNLRPGVTLNQMLIAIYRANEDAFIRGNINLVRAGRILNIPSAESPAGIDRAEADQLVKTHAAQFAEYRSRLAAVPKPAEAAAGQREVAGTIEPKPQAAPPAPAQDQVRLSKADPKVPATSGAKAAREDDSAARERALRESQSRVTDLEKNVADLQKLLELQNQQLAELQKKAGAKPTPAPSPVPAPAPVAPSPAAKAPEKPAAAAPVSPAPATTPGPVAQAPEKPAAETPQPAPTPAAKAPEKPGAKPAPKAVSKPAAQRSMLEEYVEDPMLLGGLALVLLLLVGYAVLAWRRKKKTQANFQTSVLGAAAAGAAGSSTLAEPGPVNPALSDSSVSSASTAPVGMAAEEVDPIAEADVYMAYGRDAQAEEILKEALQKDAKRTSVHAKLLEIYAQRKDTQLFEQTALKLKGLTDGAGPEWEKAAALGRSIDPQNGLYASAGGDAAAAAATAAASAAPAPALDFDLGGVSQQGGTAPDISLDELRKDSTAVDFDLGGARARQDEPTLANQPDSENTVALGGMDFNLDLGGEEKKPAAPASAAPAARPSDAGMDFDIKLDLDEKKSEPHKSPPMDLSTISLDLGSAGEPTTGPTSSDPKWQEVATKLDLAKAYQEMGDKDGARELLNEVMKDGDAAQKGQAQQLLTKLA